MVRSYLLQLKLSHTFAVSPVHEQTALLPLPPPIDRADTSTGVICETWALEVAVIPAKAGIHCANLRKYPVGGLDSRFRGNDWRLERDTIPNGTNTPTPCLLTRRRR